MKKIAAGLMLISLMGCAPDTVSRKILTIKSIERGNCIVDWSAYGTAYGDYPDQITLQVGEEMDTICRSQNIRNVDMLEKEVIVISFSGQPTLNNETIQLPEEVLGFKIVTDTSYKPLIP